jgi:hypothetical protein
MDGVRYFVLPGVDNPEGLVRSDDRGLEPEYLTPDGAWILQPALLRYTIEADTQADEVDEATAAGVAAALGLPAALVPPDAIEPISGAQR